MHEYQMRRDMFVGDRLYSYPCEVEVLSIEGTTAWARCDNPGCRGEQHALDARMYESGGGPWRTQPWAEHPRRW